MEDYFEEFSEEFSKWENIKDLAEQEISEKRTDHKHEASVQLLPRRYIALFGAIPKMEQKVYSKCKQCRMVFNPRDVLSHKNCVGKVTTTLPQNLKKKIKSKKFNSSSGYSTNSSSTNNSNSNSNSNNNNNTGSSNSSLVLKQKVLSKKYKNTRSVVVSSATSSSSPSTSTYTPQQTPSTSVVIAEAEISSEKVGSTTSPEHSEDFYPCSGGESASIPIEDYMKNMETKKRRNKKSSKSHQSTHKSKTSSSSSSSSSKPSSVAVSSTNSIVGSHTRSSSSHNSSSATTNTSTTSKAQAKAIIAAADSTETVLEQTNTTPSSPSAFLSFSPSSSSSSSNKYSSKSRRGYKTLQSKKVTTPTRSKEAAPSNDRKTAREKDLNLKQTNSSYTLPQEKQQKPATQPAAHAAPKSQPSLPPPPPPPPKQHSGRLRGSASQKEHESKKRVVEEENVTFCQSTSYVPIVATNASTDESTVSTTTYVPIIEETNENTTRHSRQTTSIYKSTANKKTNQIKADVSNCSKNLENGYNSQDGAIGTVPVVYEPMSPISVQFVKIGKKMICLESPQSAMSPPLPIQSVFFTIPDQQPASNNNTIKFFKSHPKPATIPTFGARRVDGAILVSHHQLRSKRDDILKAVLNKSTKTAPHRPNILKDDKADGKLTFKRTVPDEFHSKDNCKQTRLTQDVNGFILHADMSESADAPQTKNCIKKKIAPLNVN